MLKIVGSITIVDVETPLVCDLQVIL